VEADINEIDVNERGKSVGQKKTGYTLEDLPLPTKADQELFKTSVIIPVLSWSATLPNHFSANNHSDINSVIISHFKATFTHLSPFLDAAKTERREDHPAIFDVVCPLVTYSENFLKCILYRDLGRIHHTNNV